LINYKPLNVQVAFQGGGAKIYALIAAAKALKELEDTGVINVTRVSGSSAGSIVAALYATKMPTEKMRKYFISLPKQIPKKVPGKIRSLWRAFIMNSPLLQDRILEEKLDEISELKDKKVHDFKSPELVITASDLRWSQQITQDGNQRVIDCLLNSCRIPFVFARGKNTSSNFYDGGITGNLPVTQLLIDKEKFGPIIAFTFSSSDKARINGPISLLRQIIFSSIDSSVQKDLARGDLFKIELNGDGVKNMIDFHAMSKILDPEDKATEPVFSNNYNITREKLQEFVDIVCDQMYIENRLKNVYEINAKLKKNDNKQKWVVNYKYTDIREVHKMQDELQQYIVTNLHMAPFSEKSHYFDAIQKPEIALASDAFYTFPFFLSHIRHNFWGIIRYGYHRAIGVIVDKDSSLRDDQGDQLIPKLNVHQIGVTQQSLPATDHWMDDLIRAVYRKDGKLVSLGGYLFNEIIPLMVLEAQDKSAQANYPEVTYLVHPSIELSNESRMKSFEALNLPYDQDPNKTRAFLNYSLLQHFTDRNSKNSAIIFDLADFEILNTLINKLGANYEIYKLNHYLEIPVGIGFSLPAFKKVQENGHWNKLRKIAVTNLAPISPQLKEIGIELSAS